MQSRGRLVEPAVKHDAGKPRYDLIPPEAMEAAAHVFRIGAEKYGDRNWEKGMSWGRIFRALMSHAWKWWGGEEHDPDDGQHHLDSVIWCAMVLRAYAARRLGRDDRRLEPEPPSAEPAAAAIERTGGVPPTKDAHWFYGEEIDGDD
jgi:hypothetical protein